MIGAPVQAAEGGGDLLVAAVVGTTLAAATAGMVLTVRSQRRQRHAADAWAQARAWDHDRDGGDLHTRWSGPPFDAGHARASERVLHGRHDGRDARCLDFRYDTTTGSGARGDRHERTTRWTVVATTLTSASPDHAVQLAHPSAGTAALLEQRPHHVWRLDGGDLLLLRAGELDLATLDADLALSAAVLDSLRPPA